MDYKLPPFFDCCLTFVGFSEEEKAHMEETTIEQGSERVIKLGCLPVRERLDLVFLKASITLYIRPHGPLI